MTAAKLKELLDALGGEWSVGVARLNEFEQLFGNAEHVELLNLVGGAFFAEVQRILWDDLLLCVTRLTDPSRMGPKDNLTVKRLPDLCRHDDEFQKKVMEQVEAAAHAAKFARSHRNKRISHKDLAYAIGGSELPSATFGKIRGALDAVYAVLQTVHMELRREHLSKEIIAEPGASAFLDRTASLVNGVLCIEEMLADLSDQAAWWDEDVARDCIRRLGGTPSAENVQRIVHVRRVAQRLHTGTRST